MSTALDIEELKRLAERCICHPISLSVAEAEKSGEAIKSLIAQLEAAKNQMESQKDQWLSWEEKRRGLEKDSAELADIRALEPVAWVNSEYFPILAHSETDWVAAWNRPTGESSIALVALPEQK